MKEKKRRKLMVIIYILIIAAIAVGIFAAGRALTVNYLKKKAYNVKPLTVDAVKSKADTKAKKLMIVAHPDDDVIWGGGHLMSGGYLVVCVTDGRSKTRSEEFRKVIAASGNESLILEYPDKIAGQRDSWKNVWDKIYSDLELIMKYKKWDEIVVHNRHGEYGHLHHRNVHAIVTEIYDRNNFDCQLFCFGKYYRKDDIDSVKDKLVPISDKEYEFKKKLADMYVSQKKTVDKLWHMARYEMWTKYEKNSETHTVRPYDDPLPKKKKSDSKIKKDGKNPVSFFKF